MKLRALVTVRGLTILALVLAATGAVAYAASVAVIHRDVPTRLFIQVPEGMPPGSLELQHPDGSAVDGVFFNVSRLPFPFTGPISPLRGGASVPLMIKNNSDQPMNVVAGTTEPLGYGFVCLSNGGECSRSLLPPGGSQLVHLIFRVNQDASPGDHAFTVRFVGTTGADLPPPSCIGALASLGDGCPSSTPGTTFAAWADVVPTIDGVMDIGEWDDAECHTNQVLQSPGRGLTICVKNDDDNLYLAAIVPAQDYSDSTEPDFDFLNVLFDNNNNGVIETGEDRLNLRYDNGVVDDGYNPNGTAHHGSTDVSDNGSNDLDAAVTHSNPGPNTYGTYVAEYSHPLDSTDDAHDFSLGVGDTVGFMFRMADGDGTDDGFYWPTTVPPGWAQITITECDPEETSAELIAYQFVLPPSNFGAIFTMETDGANQTQTTFPAAYNDSDPVWSPDSTMIVFNSDRDGNLEIYSMTSTGGSQTNLTNDADDDWEPSWSHDGSMIAFHRTVNGVNQVFTMTAAGLTQTNITNNTSTNDSSPDWKPDDGSRLAIDSTRDGNLEIYTVDPAGGTPDRLTDNAGLDYDPAWSPDGSQIAWVSDRTGNREIWVMDATDGDGDGNGDNPIQLTNVGGVDSYPAWSADGTQIVFATNRAGAYEVHTMDAVDADGDLNGDNPTNLTNTGPTDTQPDWSAVPVP